VAAEVGVFPCFHLKISTTLCMGVFLVLTLVVASLACVMTGTESSPIVIDVDSSSPAVSPVKIVKNKREYR